MLIVKRLLVTVALVLIPLMALDQRDLSLRADRVVPPRPPVNTINAGLVVIEVDYDHEMFGTTILEGQSPFLASAMSALEQWTFTIPPGTPVARTSVTFLFRPSSPYAVKIPAGPVKAPPPGSSRAALATAIIDPGYPFMSEAEGVVILELSVGAEGNITHIETVDGIAGLTEQAEEAVRNWKFAPAFVAGNPAPSTAIAVISFLRP